MARRIVRLRPPVSKKTARAEGADPVRMSELIELHEANREPHRGLVFRALAKTGPLVHKGYRWSSKPMARGGFQTIQELRRTIKAADRSADEVEVPGA